MFSMFLAAGNQTLPSWDKIDGREYSGVIVHIFIATRSPAHKEPPLVDEFHGYEDTDCGTVAQKRQGFAGPAHSALERSTYFSEDTANAGGMNRP